MENEKFGERRRIKVYFLEGKNFTISLRDFYLIFRLHSQTKSNNLLLCQERVIEKEKKKTIIFKT